MTWDFILPAGVALQMQRAVANGGDRIRSYLGGVHVEPIADGGAFLVATDGIAMLIHRDPTAYAARAATIKLTEMWYGDECEDCGTPVRSHPGDCRIHIGADIANGAVAAPCHYTRFEPEMHPAFHVVAERIAQPFPDWRRVISAEDSARAHLPGPRIDHIDPERLHRICSHWAGPVTRGGLRIHQHAPGRPWLVTFTTCENTLAVLMPHTVPAAPVLDRLLAAIGRQDLLQDPGSAA